jgi:hypothetical protein
VTPDRQRVLDWLEANERSHAWLAGKVGVTPPHLSHCLSGRRRISDALAASMLDGNAYLNVHTLDHPGGEIRGQVIATRP